MYDFTALELVRQRERELQRANERARLIREILPRRRRSAKRPIGQ